MSGERLILLKASTHRRSHLLSPSSPFSDVTFASYEKNIAFTQNVRDEDAIIFAEIAEYARSLIALPKGQELPLAGLPQLLPYKLQRAWLAAELGDVDQAKRCVAILSSLTSDTALPSRYPPSRARMHRSSYRQPSWQVWKI